jgi:hypothetical protein
LGCINQLKTFINIGYHYEHLYDGVLGQLDLNIEECAIG